MFIYPDYRQKQQQELTTESRLLTSIAVVTLVGNVQQDRDPNVARFSSLVRCFLVQLESERANERESAREKKREKERER